MATKGSGGMRNPAGKGGGGNSQISTQTSAKAAVIKKSGQTIGQKFGMNPSAKQKGGN